MESVNASACSRLMSVRFELPFRWQLVAVSHIATGERGVDSSWNVVCIPETSCICRHESRPETTCGLLSQPNLRAAINFLVQLAQLLNSTLLVTIQFPYRIF